MPLTNAYSRRPFKKSPRMLRAAALAALTLTVACKDSTAPLPNIRGVWNGTAPALDTFPSATFYASLNPDVFSNSNGSVTTRGLRVTAWAAGRSFGADSVSIFWSAGSEVSYSFRGTVNGDTMQGFVTLDGSMYKASLTLERDLRFSR